MKSTDSSSITLRADQEHDKLRTVLVLLLIIIFFLCYWLVNTILQLDFWGSLRDYTVALSCVIGLVLALAISFGLEILLKRIWPSGRSLSLDENHVIIHDEPAGPQQIDIAKGPAHLRWHFQLKGYRRGGREKRLPKNSVCLAYQLQQGDTRLIIHSYMSPAKAEPWLENITSDIRFNEIHPKEVYDKALTTRLGAPTRPQISNEILTGSNGRYWLAERHRWDEGFELTPQDFAIFMDFVTRGMSES